MVDGKYQMVTLDYVVHPDDLPEDVPSEGKERYKYYLVL